MCVCVCVCVCVCHVHTHTNKQLLIRSVVYQITVELTILIIAHSDFDPVYMSTHPHCFWPHHVTNGDNTLILLLNATVT